MIQRALLSIVALTVCLHPLAADDAVTEKVALFDGKSLEGWDGDPKFWRIEDGAITGETTAENPTNGNTFCVWNGEVDDFELEFQCRIEGHNSGVQIRSFRLEDGADRWRIGGYQVDFDAENNWTGALYGERFRTLLAKRGERVVLTGAEMSEGKRPQLVAQRQISKIADAEELVKHVNAYPEWNQFRVVAQGFDFKIFINGQLMSECRDDDKVHRRSKGLLAFQLHGGPPMKVQFKDIELTPLKSEGSVDSEKPTVVFEEDFESGFDRWDFIDPKSWKLEDHGLGQSLCIIQRESQYQPKVRSPLHIALIRDVEAANFELTFKVKSTKNTGNHRDCCVFFNYQDPTNFYYVHLGAKPDPASGQIMIVDDSPRRPLTKNEKPTPWSESGWHEVKLVRDAEAGTIKVFFDDMETPHMQVNDKTFGKGRLGIGSFDDMDAFDEIKLSIH